jgi:hypothetical protein
MTLPPSSIAARLTVFEVLGFMGFMGFFAQSLPLCNGFSF